MVLLREVVLHPPSLLRGESQDDRKTSTGRKSAADEGSVLFDVVGNLPFETSKCWLVKWTVSC